jgi:hypothetical protein
MLSRDRKCNSTPGVRYEEAIAKAVEWLGDRYLLACPINARMSGALHTPRDDSIGLMNRIGPTSSAARRRRPNGGPRYDR